MVSVVCTADDRQRTTSFQVRHKTLQAHWEWENAYATTVIGPLIDAQTNDLFAQGYNLIGDMEDGDDAIAEVQRYLDDMDLEPAMRAMAMETRKHGYGICEVAKTNDGRYKLVPVSSINLMPKRDDKGWLDGFEQIDPKNNDRVQASLSLDQCVHLSFTSSIIDLGISQIARAWQPLKDYCDITKAAVNIIWRHGYPKYDMEITKDENGLTPADIPQRIEGVTADLSPGSELTSGMGMAIKELDKGGVPQVQTYTDFALQQLAVSLGMPRSSLGLTDNSEATAKVTRSMYYNRIEAECGIIARAIQTQYLDTKVLPSLGLRSGDIKIQFNNADPEAQLSKVQYVQALAAIDPMDPYAISSKAEMASILGKHPKKGEYDDDGTDGFATKIMELIKGGGTSGRQNGGTQ